MNPTDDPQPPFPDLSTELLLALRSEPLDEAVQARISERINRGLRQRKALRLQRADQAEWIQLGPGVSLRILQHEPETGRLTAIWQLQAGACIPPHPHDQDEECLILDGDMCHEQDRYGPGDWMLAPAGSQHQHLRSVAGCRMLIRGSDLPLRMQMA